MASGGICYRVGAQHYPWTCPETGAVAWSPVINDFWICSIAPPRCITYVGEPTLPELDDIDSLRVAVEVLYQCDPSPASCLIEPAQGPYWDNIRLGVVNQPVSAPENAPSDDLVPSVSIRTPYAAGAPFSMVIPRAGQVELDIIDVRGGLIRRVCSGVWSAGTQQVSWDGRSDRGIELPAGVYFLRLVTEAGSATSKVVLVR